MRSEERGGDLLRAALVAPRKPSEKHGALLRIERACCEVDGTWFCTACHASEHRRSVHGRLSRVSFAPVDCMTNAPLASLTLFCFRLCIYQAVLPRLERASSLRRGLFASPSGGTNQMGCRRFDVGCSDDGHNHGAWSCATSTAASGRARPSSPERTSCVHRAKMCARACVRF